MEEGETISISLTVKVYRHVRVAGATDMEAGAGRYLAKFRVFLNDRPGSLSGFSSVISSCHGNISFFHYDRSVDSSRVAVEIGIGRRDLDSLLHALEEKKYAFEPARTQKEEINITDPENIFEIRIRLANEIGALSTFARLLKKHRANVIYMLYDEDIDPESADIALATRDAREIDELLDAVNRKGYYYRVVYRGSDEPGVRHVIGLKLVEKFFLRLRTLLAEHDREEVKALVDSSQELHADLVEFYSEAGKNLEAADVFEQVLTLASMSRTRTGTRFSAIGMKPLDITESVRLLGFRLPTSENIYVFLHRGEATMIDAGYGTYYEDIKSLLESKGVAPSSVRRIFITHCDADHAGTSGFFAGEFGTKVFIHPEGRGIIESGNRARGTSGRLHNLNKYYSRLVNRFTDCRFPENPGYFSTAFAGKEGPFNIIDHFWIGDLEFQVLQSRGGHIPGVVFFLNREHGLFFTSDYLINVQSLSTRDRDNLGVYRYLLTNPNSDPMIFKQEVADLREMIKTLDHEARQAGREIRIFPGHGDYYRAREMK